ncbi:thioesterase family protein [Xylaria telfairii]|nr:thioesterase family protein [Xylaria telfairii]
MAAAKSSWTSVAFSEAMKVKKLAPRTYKINLNDNFNIGAVPNGGYTASCMLAAASDHMASQGQPDVFTAHFEYLNRTSNGPAIVIIEDVKLTGQISILQLTLWQGGLKPSAPWITPSVSQRTVLAYARFTDLSSSKGISMPTGYETTAPDALPPLPDFERLKAEGSDPYWTESRLPGSNDSLRSLRNWHLYVPRGDPLIPGVLNAWLRSASGENIKQGALTYVADTFPVETNTFIAAPEVRTFLLQQQAEARDQALSDKRAGKKKEGGESGVLHSVLWFPTVVLNLEVKKALPEEGAEWLALSVMSKQMRDGRFDIEIVVRDVEGEIIALSHQVALIVSIETNRGKKRRPNKAAL